MTNFYCFSVHFSSVPIFNFGLVHYGSQPFNYYSYIFYYTTLNINFSLVCFGPFEYIYVRDQTIDCHV